MAEYDHILFMAPKCQTLFYTDLAKTKLLSEPGISLEKVLENLPTFYDRLVATEWKIFAPGPCRANEHKVRKFYANLSIVSTSDPVIRI